MCETEKQSRLSLSRARFSLNHPYRAYARNLSVSLANIHVHFCSTIVANKTSREREREHYRFWNTHTPKKETEDDAMRAFAHAYNSLFLATLLLWSTSITRRAFFYICSLTASERAR